MNKDFQKKKQEAKKQELENQKKINAELLVNLKKEISRAVKKVKDRKPENPDKLEHVIVIKEGTHKRIVTALWVLLIFSVCFGIYKNFTAVDTHTVHEEKIIEQRLIDTNAVENFVKDFAAVYYSWENNKDSIEKRTSTLEKYLTKELQSLNEEMIRLDIPTSSEVKDIQITGVEMVKNNENDDTEFLVKFRVTQGISEGKEKNNVRSAYETTVHMDQTGGMVIIKNPTICRLAEKSSYEPEKKETDSEVSTEDIQGATEFLEMFFKMYPSATEQEMSYYVKGNALEPVGMDYVYSQMVNPVFSEKDDKLGVTVSVVYLDQRTKAEQISQFDLVLKKGDNWMIIE